MCQPLFVTHVRYLDLIVKMKYILSCYPPAHFNLQLFPIFF